MPGVARPGARRADASGVLVDATMGATMYPDLALMPQSPIAVLHSVAHRPGTGLVQRCQGVTTKWSTDDGTIGG